VADPLSLRHGLTSMSPTRQQAPPSSGVAIGELSIDAQVNYVPQDPGNRQPVTSCASHFLHARPADFYPRERARLLGGEHRHACSSTQASKQQNGQCVARDLCLWVCEVPSPPRLVRHSAGVASLQATPWHNFTGNARLPLICPPMAPNHFEKITTYKPARQPPQPSV